jgi:hypothetical protein
MTNEEIIEELLFEAERLRLREEVLETTARILQLNPRMERIDAVKLSLDNAKLHAGLNKTI